MDEEVLGHIEFWTQFRQYLGDHNIQIRLSKPSNSSSSNVLLRRSYFRLRSWRLLKHNRLGICVEFNEPGTTARYELVERQHRRQVDERLSPLGALDWKPDKILLSPSTPSRPETWQEQYKWMASAIETTRTLFNEILPPPAPLKLEFYGEKLVNSDTGEEYDVPAVAARLPWRKQGGEDRAYDPLQHMPPHWYVVIGACDWADWDVLYFACTKHPASYAGYFRGYQSPMQYLELGDGCRYWPTRLGVMMLNRCALDSVEPPRRVDRGARPIKQKEWGAPPWLPQGSGWPPSYLKKHPALAREPGGPLDP